ncbi:hypothetical protein, partial [Achromobacter sp. GbtcB20]|uniref:hypothetical protein n=1 Tax=Achromobacter sp. GbtcB20 TaxID=2824765 RepID=UPI001C30A3B8
MHCTRKNRGTCEGCGVTAQDGATVEVTGQEGVERFALSPDNRKLLVHYSTSYVPTQLATVSVNGGAVAELTDTR